MNTRLQKNKNNKTHVKIRKKAAKIKGIHQRVEKEELQTFALLRMRPVKGSTEQSDRVPSPMTQVHTVIQVHPVPPKTGAHCDLLQFSLPLKQVHILTELNPVPPMKLAHAMSQLNPGLRRQAHAVLTQWQSLRLSPPTAYHLDKQREAYTAVLRSCKAFHKHGSLLVKMLLKLKFVDCLSLLL